MPSATQMIAANAREAEEVLDILISRNNRASKILLKDPHSYTDSSWHLCLPPHFNTPLDLQYLNKQEIKNKEVVRRWKGWTQLSTFCFNEGSIIYDRDVSGLSTWGDILDAIEFYVVIGKTTPVSTKVSNAQETPAETEVTRNSGLVNFRLYIPTKDHGSTVDKEYTVTQDQFVRYAISGSL